MNTESVTSYSQSFLGEASNSARAQLDQQEFLNLLIGQFQQQDPMNPADAGDLVSQLAQLQTLQATAALTDGINKLADFQGMVTASSMVGKVVRGISNETNEVITGKVSAASFENDTVNLIIGEHSMDMRNVLLVLDSEVTGE